MLNESMSQAEPTTYLAWMGKKEGEDSSSAVLNACATLWGPHAMGVSLA